MLKMIRLSFTLALYSVIACLALAMVNAQTAPIIAKAKQEKINLALKEIFPDASNFVDVSGDMPKSIDKITIENAYIAQHDEKPIGMTLTFSGHTYDHASILIGIDLDKKLKKIKFLELTDSPGLGSRAAEPPFITQFENKSITDHFKVGDDITVISGATITSKAVSTMVKIAVDFADSFLQKQL